MSSANFLSASTIESGMRLDSYDLEALGQIKFGVFPVMEAHVVDQIPLHGSLALPIDETAENDRAELKR